jgi:glycyl-tRNA synthetase beta chain
MEPTGSKDPFALRRAGNAIVRILAESTLPLTISDMSTVAISSGAANLGPFFTERIDFYLREIRGQSYDVAKAAMAGGTDDLRDLTARAEAVTAVRGSEDFLAVSAAFKRMKNILTQARANGDQWDSVWGGAVYPAEIVLQDAASDVRKRVDLLAKDGRYQEALQEIAGLRPEIDTFFDQVMILDQNPNVRKVRLGMLSIIVGDLSGIADFSEIVTAG